MTVHRTADSAVDSAVVRAVDSAVDDLAAAGNGGQGAPARHTGTAARIVAAAGGLLDETGSEAAVTLRAVARRAGVSAPAIYGHYPDVPSILLVVVQDAFAALAASLRVAAGGGTPVAEGESDPASGRAAAARLRAVCDAYTDFAARHPQRYRVMFGGVWSGTRAVDTSTVTRQDVQALGQDCLDVFVAALDACIRAGASDSRDATADAVALWLGLHGLADQRVAAPAFPWPSDITGRIVTAAARLSVPDHPGR